MENDFVETSKRTEEQKKLLLEIIRRYDVYVGTTNSKIAVILSYSVAYVFGVAVKFADLLEKHNCGLTWWFAVLFVCSSAAVTLYAAYVAYEALNPLMPSGRAQHESPSIIFFGDVSGLVGGRDGYVRRIMEITDVEIVEDLARQAHILACVVAKKMETLNRAVCVVAKVQMPLSVLAVIALCLTFL